MNLKFNVLSYLFKWGIIKIKTERAVNDRGGRFKRVLSF